MAKLRNNVIIFTGFFIWILAIGLVPRHVEFGKTIINAIGAFGFLCVALFLPNVENSRCFGRKSAIAWMSVLIYLSVDQLINVGFNDLTQLSLLLQIIPVIVSIGVYYMALKTLVKNEK
jgi:hypothetical protein